MLPPPPNGPLTIRDFEATPTTNHGLYELVEGRLVIGPHPAGVHQYASFEVAAQVHKQCPKDLRVLTSVDIDLQLGPADGPGHSRRPDIVVTSRAAARQADAEDRMLRASEVVLVIEVADDWSARTDMVVKQDEYRDSGIPHYWIVDVRTPTEGQVDGPILWCCYPEATASGLVFSVVEPFAVSVDLATMSAEIASLRRPG